MSTHHKKILHYLPLLLLVTLYVLRRHALQDVMTILRSIVVLSFGYVAAYIDFKTRKIPNKLVFSMLATWAVLMAVQVVVDIERAIDLLSRSLVSGVAAGGFFLVIYLVSRKGIGGGDVKLMSVIGLYITFSQLMPMLFFSSLLTAIVSGILLLTKRATMKTAIPLVPFLFMGLLIILFL